MKTAPLVILFADKSPGQSRQLRLELRRRGAHVILAGSTEGAIHQAALAPPDIVVMDDDLKKDLQTDLGTFIHDAFPNAGIILLYGSGPPTCNPCGLDLLLWAHKCVADQTLIETIECAFPGRLDWPTAHWPRARQILCVDDQPSHVKSLSWFVAPQAAKAPGFRGGGLAPKTRKGP